MKLRHSILCLCVIASSAACFRPLFPGSEKIFPPDGPTPGGSQSDDRSTAGLIRKRVAEKLEPATLLSNDGYRCTTTAERFKDIRLGSNVWCAWQKQ